jgi:hypothetical protein
MGAVLHTRVCGIPPDSTGPCSFNWETSTRSQEMSSFRSAAVHSACIDGYIEGLRRSPYAMYTSVICMFMCSSSTCCGVLLQYTASGMGSSNCNDCMPMHPGYGAHRACDPTQITGAANGSVLYTQPAIKCHLT